MTSVVDMVVDVVVLGVSLELSHAWLRGSPDLDAAGHPASHQLSSKVASSATTKPRCAEHSCKHDASYCTFTLHLVL
jgi:hypothetical protein